MLTMAGEIQHMKGVIQIMDQKVEATEKLLAQEKASRTELSDTLAALEKQMAKSKDESKKTAMRANVAAKTNGKVQAQNMAIGKVGVPV